MPQFPRVQSRHLPKLRGIRFGTDGDTGFFSFFPQEEINPRGGRIWMPASQNLGILREQRHFHAW